MHTLEESITTERALVDSIKRHTRARTGRILVKVVLTFGLPYLVFMAVWVSAGFLRPWLAENYADEGLNQMTTFTTVLLLVLGPVFVWRWADNRFRGGTLLGRLLGVARAVLRVEDAIAMAKAKPQPDAHDLTHIERLAHDAWAMYNHAMRQAGLPLHAEED